MDCPTWDGILLSAAAVIAATIAAITAIWRQRRQLDAEAGRLERQLAHDRQLREEEETRAVLDDAMQAAGLAVDFTSEILSDGLLGKAKREAGVPHESLDATEVVRKARNVLVSLAAQGQRLRLRFGEGHELFVSYQRLLIAMKQQSRSRVKKL